MQMFNRKCLSLSGEWGFYVDPMERGIRQEWWKNDRKEPWCFPCYDECVRTVTVPHTWASEPDLKYYEGVCLYSKRFDFEYSETGRVYIRFGAVNYKCNVYLNSEYVCSHEGGYLEFTAEVTSLIKKKNNNLWIMADNSRSKDRIPSVIFDWWNDGGIIRDVEVFEAPSQHAIEDYKVTTSLKGGKVCIDLSVFADCEVRVQIEELGIDRTIHGNTVLELPENNVRLYSHEDPYRYKIIFSTSTDQVSEYVGFREIKISGRDVLLNGTKLMLKGVNVHEDYGTTGCADIHDEIDKVFDKLQELGVNFIRSSHYPHSRYFVDKAEKLGIFILEEIPLYWYVFWDEFDIESKAKRQLDEMIARDKNRANILIWGVGNEMSRDLSNAPHIASLANYVRTLDLSRPVSYVCSIRDKQPDGNFALFMPDYMYEALDIISINCYCSFMDDGTDKGDCARVVRAYEKFGKPILVTECGAQSVLGNKEGGHHDEARHRNILKQQIEEFFSTDLISGVAVWILKDGRTPLYYLRNSLHLFRYGLCDESLTEKLAFKYLKQKYSEL